MTAFAALFRIALVLALTAALPLATARAQDATGAQGTADPTRAAAGSAGSSGSRTGSGSAGDPTGAPASSSPAGRPGTAPAPAPATGGGTANRTQAPISTPAAAPSAPAALPSATTQTAPTGPAGSGSAAPSAVTAAPVTPAPPVAAPPALRPAAPASTNERVALVPLAAVANARLLIQNAGGLIISLTPLPAFDQMMIVYRAPAGDAGDALADQIGGEIENGIDAPRTIYRLSAGTPRVYAKGLLNWPSPAPCRGASLGIVDGPVDETVAVRLGQRLTQARFVPGGEDPISTEHGTAVAGLIAGVPEVQGSALSDATPLHAAAAFYDDDGETRGDTERIASALDWLTGQDVQVVNLSFAGADNAALARLFAQMTAKGISLVAAAGNAGLADDPDTSFPAHLPGVIAVTSVDTRMALARDANSGRFIDFAGPGVDLYVPAPGGAGRYVSGTSFAAPFVSTLAAIYRARNPQLTGEAVQLALRQGTVDLGDPGRDDLFGWGLVQAGPLLCAD